MPGLVQLTGRSDAGFGCFTAVCTDAQQRQHYHALWARACVRLCLAPLMLVCYSTLATAFFGVDYLHARGLSRGLRSEVGSAVGSLVGSTVGSIRP